MDNDPEHVLGFLDSLRGLYIYIGTWQLHTLVGSLVQFSLCFCQWMHKMGRLKKFCLVGLGLEFNALHGLIACGKQTISTLIGCWRYYHLVFSGYDLIWANLDISEFGPDQLWLHQLDWPFVYLNHLQWMAMSWLRAFISFDEGPFQHLDHWMEVSYPCLVKGQIQSLGASLRLILHVVESSC